MIIKTNILCLFSFIFWFSGGAFSNQYSLVLIGGGLQLCTSIEQHNCDSKLKLDSSNHNQDLFQISTEAITYLSNSHWRVSRQELKSQLLHLLQTLNAQQPQVLNKKNMLNLLKTAQAQIAGRTMSGRQLLSRLDDAELHLLFDTLQLLDQDKAFIGEGQRRQVKVSLSKTKNKFSAQLLRKFINLANQTSSKKQADILFVTAGNRDSFAQVDVYQSALEQAGASVTWLPIDIALNHVLEMKGKVADTCELLEQNRNLLQGSYRRAYVYPDLAKYQKQFCLQPKKLQQLLKEADGVFFSGSDPTRLTASFLDAQGRQSRFLTLMKQRYAAGELVIAANDEVVSAMAGGINKNSPVAMTTGGTSLAGLTQGAWATRAQLGDCEKSQSCNKHLNSNSLTYNAKGGLGFFDKGVLDAHLSERNRQARLLRVAIDSGTSMGYGIDQRTALLLGLDNKENQDFNMQVIGENGVYIIDTSQVKTFANFRPKISTASSHYLTHEDKVFYRNGKFIISFANWKYSVNNSAKPIIQSGNWFQQDNYRRLTNLLCLTSSKHAQLTHKKMGKGVSVFIQKARTSVSLTGSRNVHGRNYASCSYRDYYLDINTF